jgi:mannose-6-phosphate isomerase-like protein (cupin superfamily)
VTEPTLTAPAVVAPRAGEVIGDAPDRRVEILTDQEAMHATWSRFAPGRDGAGRHVHRRHHDLFYVLAGELTLKLGTDDEAVAPAGTVVRVPPMVVHGFRNGGDAEVRYLNFHAPGTGFAEYLRALRDGRVPSFDQEPPPADALHEGAVIGGEEVVLDRPDVRVALLADLDAVGISETRADPGGDPVGAHVHHRHAESFYALEGEIRATVAGREIVVGPGAWLTIPPGVPHGLTLGGAEPVRFLNLHAPRSGFDAFVRALGETGGDAHEAAARTPFDEEPI